MQSDSLVAYSLRIRGQNNTDRLFKFHKMNAVLSHAPTFERAFGTNHALVSFISQVPQYADMVLQKVFSTPKYFDQLIHDDAGWAAIKPFVTIEVLKDADSFETAR